MEFQRAVEESVREAGYSPLKVKQQEALEAFVSGKDTFVALPTGYGKSVLPHMRMLAHTRMGRPIRVYSYGTPIRVWDNILSHISIIAS